MTKETKKIIFMFIMSVVLAILTSKFIGGIVYNILKPISGFGPQMQCPECLDGFILGYLFFISLLLNLIKLGSKYWLIFLLPMIVFINPPFEFLIIGIGLVIIGWLLAQGVLFIKTKKKL